MGDMPGQRLSINENIAVIDQCKPDMEKEDTRYHEKEDPEYEG